MIMLVGIAVIFFGVAFLVALAGVFFVALFALVLVLGADLIRLVFFGVFLGAAAFLVDFLAVATIGLNLKLLKEHAL